MITLLTGENSFGLRRELASIVKIFGGNVEKYDGQSLSRNDLPSLFMGANLFSNKRLIVINDLSDNSELWAELDNWLKQVSDDNHIVFVEPKPDKRTRTYKTLAKQASVKEFQSWTNKDAKTAEDWLIGEAKQENKVLDKKSANLLVRRVGVDQWALYHALQKLLVFDDISPTVIERVIEPTLVENVFDLFETAIKGDVDRVDEILSTLRLTEDPYRLFGLLTNQAFQLLALAIGSKSNSQIASDIGAHPFAVSKLNTYARKLESDGAKKLIVAFAEADSDMKLSKAEPWLLIERALLKSSLLKY